MSSYISFFSSSILMNTSSYPCQNEIFFRIYTIAAHIHKFTNTHHSQSVSVQPRALYSPHAVAERGRGVAACTSTSFIFHRFSVVHFIICCINVYFCVCVYFPSSFLLALYFFLFFFFLLKIVNIVE